MNRINLAGSQLDLYGAQAFSNVGVPDKPYYLLSPGQSSVVLGIDAIAQVFVSDATGPIGGALVVALRDDGKGEVFATDPSGLAEFHFGAGSAFTLPVAPPLHLFVALNASKDPDTHLVSFDAKVSDEVWVGDTNGLHTHWRVKLAAISVLPPPPPPVVPMLAEPLDASLRTLAWHMRGVSFNADAALYKAALAKGLGYPLSGEFPFTDKAGSQYVAQLFAGGIAYCIVGDYGNVKIVSWL